MTARPACAPAALHASAVVVGEVGVLLRGPSGAGKSRLAVSLVEAARRDGRFAGLVADDRTLLAVHGARLVAAPHPALAGRIERRGLGIVACPYEPACVLGLVIDLAAESVPRLPEPDDATATLAGIALPRLALPPGMPAADAASFVLARLAGLAPPPQDPSPFFLPSPPRCTR